MEFEVMHVGNNLILSSQYIGLVMNETERYFPGLVVIEEDSRPRGTGFDSRRRPMLDGFCRITSAQS